MVSNMISKLDIKLETEERLYEQVASEIISGEIRQGHWLKAFAENDGNEARAKAAYSKMRVAQLARDLEEALLREAKEALLREAKAEQEALQAPMIKLKTELHAKNYAIGDGPSGGYILYTPSGECLPFRTFDLLRNHFFTEIKNGH